MESDNASAIVFAAHKEYSEYPGDESKPVLPWETTDKLTGVLGLLMKDIEKTEKYLFAKNIIIPERPTLESGNKKNIEVLRLYRRRLSNAQLHADLQLDKSLENCINDALEIRPNFPFGDDNLPAFTVPAHKPDIECFYKTFNSIYEVTMLNNRSQWINEGQPVMRHSRNFEDYHKGK